MSLKIFQIYYRPEQRSEIDPEFQPYNNEGNKSILLEFSVFQKLFAQLKGSDVDLWGAMSWKFGKKTGLTGKTLKKLIHEHPGYDVYFCNPYPEVEALYHNLWYQGESAHPVFAELGRDFLTAAGQSGDVVDQLMPARAIATTNYFVATQEFWGAYLAFVSALLERAERELLPTTKAIIFSALADSNGIHARSTYIPFIVERLFSLFLTTAGRNFRALKYPVTSNVVTRNQHLRNMLAMKDEAIASRQPSRAECWEGYRNLYLIAINPAMWTADHLRQISPPRALFAAEPVENIAVVTRQG